MINISTGAKIAMTGSQGLKAALANCVVDLYSGARPLTADAAVTGTKLARITLNAGSSTYLNFLDPDTTGQIAKDVAESWKGFAIAAGTIGWARVQLPTDAGAVSLVLPRLDLVVAVSGGDLDCSTLTAAISPSPTPHSIDQLSFYF